MNIHNSDLNSINMKFGSHGMIYSDKTSFKSKRPDIIINNFITRDKRDCLFQSRIVENLDLSVPGKWAVLKPLVPEHP